MTAPRAEFNDIQGLVHAGYASLTQSRFLLLRVADPAAARAWLAAAPVTSAAARDVTAVLQVAVTAEGLRALGVTEPIIAGFSDEFRAGMAGEESRSHRLGDVGANAPSSWRWGADPPHVLVMLYAAQALDTWQAGIETEAFRQGFTPVARLETSDMQGHEPFGFVDGVSQPSPDWDGARIPGTTADLDYGNAVAAGEFLLGYRNEYGLYTDRPLLDGTTDRAAALPPAEDDPQRRDLGRNGSYLVFRELHQDVRGFWRWMAAQSSDDAGAVALAEAVVGRGLSGAPLLPGIHRVPGTPDTAAAIAENGFLYGDDPDGLRCPFGAHIRRANPRTGDLPGGKQGPIGRLLATLQLFRPDLRQDLVAATRFHRLLRRGREFGAFLPREQAVHPDAPDPRSGLHFICLNANIARQFEFVQNAWLMSGKFDGLTGEADPLTGNRAQHPPEQATDGFSLPQPNGVARRLTGLPPFVTVAGGAYFFLPGLRALRYIAGA